MNDKKEESLLLLEDKEANITTRVDTKKGEILRICNSCGTALNEDKFEKGLFLGFIGGILVTLCWMFLN